MMDGGMMDVYFGLGSNQENALGSPFWHMQQAVKKLSELGELTASSLYKSAPMGPQDQPDYLNAVVKVVLTPKTLALYPPKKLLAFTQSIEITAQRQKTRHWGERSIDIDILLYGHEKIKEPSLTIPHVGILQRNFVAVPLAEISPHLVLEGMVDSIAHMPIANNHEGLEKLTDKTLRV